MSGEYAWQGRAEDNEAHLRLTFAEDVKVREVWERAAAARPELDRMMREIRDRTQPMGSQLPGDKLASEGVPEIDFSLKGLPGLAAPQGRQRTAGEARSRCGLWSPRVGVLAGRGRAARGHGRFRGRLGTDGRCT